jgi:type II secretory pathway component GspD/PulD (secretin)
MVGPPLPKDIPFPSRPVEDAEKKDTGAPLLGKVKEAVIGGASEEERTPVELTMGEDESGYWLRGARLNDVFQYLARLGGLQFFHNAELEDPSYVVTGHLGDGDPVSQMEELGLMYGVTVHQKGNTVYALTETQLTRLPTKPFQYHLNYLRPSDIEQIMSILQPVLTPGTGTVGYEEKTNTLIVIDNEQKIEAVKEILAEMDKPKQQIAIETRILRVKSSARNRIGVDWETVLGDGLTVEGTEALNALFNLPDSDQIEEVVTLLKDHQGRDGYTVASVGTLAGFNRGATTPVSVSSKIPETGTDLSLSGNVQGIGSISGFAAESGASDGFFRGQDFVQTVTRTGSPLVLSPLQLQATLRALNTGGLAQQESSPTLITEDNEDGIISIIDRYPIIVTTVTETVSGTNISEDVRYRVDLDDPVGDARDTREIGITVAVTPTILPDDTIRMKLRPRSAQIVEFIQGKGETGNRNLYPRVNESTVDTIARVPNGHSLLIGGFYEEAEIDGAKKVPILGDIPILKFAFKSTDIQKENTSLIFVVTPKLYEPVSIPQTQEMTRGLHDRHVLPLDHKWPDRRYPGLNYESRLGWTAGNLLKAYPEVPPSNPLNPDHPDNLFGPAEVELPTADKERISPYSSGQSDRPHRRGLFRRLFKKKNR